MDENLEEIEPSEVIEPKENKEQELFTSKEAECLKQTTEVRSKLISMIMEKNENTIHNNPKLLEALNGIMNSQDAQALGTAKLRQTAESNKNENENIKALITATLRAVTVKKENNVTPSDGREVKHVDVSLIEGQTDTNVKQFSIEELEANVKKKQGQRPSDILKEQ